MTVSRLDGCEAGVDADIGRRLVDAETEARNFDGGIGERKEVCDGEGRGKRLGFRFVVCFSFCSAFVCRLKLGRQGLVVRRNVSAMLRQ